MPCLFLLNTTVLDFFNQLNRYIHDAEQIKWNNFGQDLHVDFSCLQPAVCYASVPSSGTEKELGKELILHLKDRRQSVPWNATFLSVNNQGQIVMCHHKTRWERAVWLGLLSCVATGANVYEFKSLWGSCNRLAFFNNAKGPNSHPVRRMSHITEQSSPWVTLLKYRWAAWLVQTDDADFNAAQLSPEGKLPSWTGW